MIQLFINIKELLQVRTSAVEKVSGKEMKILPTIKNAFLIVTNDLITGFGSMNELPKINANEVIDVSGKMILPTWCDSHTHIVFAENREQEFVDRINGISYQEIANRGGGILNSALKLQATSEEELYEQATSRIASVIRLGTGALEIKSGYGLTVDAELKILRVIQQLKKHYSIPIKATFLGAHAIPKEFKNNKEGYIRLIIEEMLPKIAQEKLADFIDVFCEIGYFTSKETEKIIIAGKKIGLIPKIHVNQFNTIGGVKTGVQNNALSVDHLEIMTPNDIKVLKKRNTMPVVLPSCSFFLGIPYAPARTLIDNGLPLALASDYNPGSSPSGNMNFVVSTACIKMKLTPEEAINAATINGAYAMNISKEVGSICIGKKANFIITENITSYHFIPYNFGNNCIESVYINGRKLH